MRHGASNSTCSTIALGSVFATLILSKDIALSEGVLGLGLLVFLQYVVAWLSVRSTAFQDIVKGKTTLLFYRGRYLHGAMKQERVTAKEGRFAARAAGVRDLAQLGAVILKQMGDGTFSVQTPYCVT